MSNDTRRIIIVTFYTQDTFMNKVLVDLFLSESCTPKRNGENGMLSEDGDTLPSVSNMQNLRSNG